mgnify:CR=1 FL=1
MFTENKMLSDKLESTFEFILTKGKLKRKFKELTLSDLSRDENDDSQTGSIVSYTHSSDMALIFDDYSTDKTYDPQEHEQEIETEEGEEDDTNEDDEKGEDIFTQHNSESLHDDVEMLAQSMKNVEF